MLIQCEKCSTRYNLDEAKIPGKGAKVTCPTCKHVFIVMKGQGAAPGMATTSPGAPAPAAAPAPPPAASPGQPKSLLDSFFDDSKTMAGGTPFSPGPAPGAAPPSAAGRAIRSWKVRVASGLVYDFTDVATLKAWIAEKKVTTADQISSDGATWTVIGTIPNLDAFFGGPAMPSPTPPPGALPPMGLGAPGPAPATGFGPAPAGAPAAPAFASPGPPGNNSLADLFNSPAPGNGADPFGGGPPPGADPFAAPRAPTPPPVENPFASAPRPPTNPPGPNPFAAGPAAPPPGANPFAGPGMPPPPMAPNPFGGPPAAPPPGANPFGGPPPAGANPFGPPTAPPPATNPFGGPAMPPPTPPPAFGDPFGAAPSPGGDPFGAAPSPGGDPFGAAPASGGDPFGADPFAGGPAAPAPAPAPAPGANPFGPAGGDPFGGGSPMMGPKPAPPPWLSGSAPAPTPPPPLVTGVAPPPPPVAIPGAPRPSQTWMGAPGEGAPAAPAAIPTKPPRKIGRTVGLAFAGLVVVAGIGGVTLNLERIRTAMRPLPTPALTPTPPPIVTVLEGPARDAYLRGRRLLRVDSAEAYAKAEAEFRSALAAANGNPRAAAGVLESLALQKGAGAPVPDEALAKAQGDAIAALKEDPQGLEINRALAQLYAVTGKPADALGHLESALAAQPADAESLYLRSRLRAADPAQADAAKGDLAAAATDPTLTRAVKALAEGAKPKSPEAKALAALETQNAATLAALEAGTWTSTAEELARLLPGVQPPTPTPSAAPVESPVVAVPSPATTVATPAPTPSAVAATPTPAKTPIAAVSPVNTPLAAVSPLRTPKPTPARTPLAATTTEPNRDPTPVPSPTPDSSLIATATAQDHVLAAQAYEQAGAYADAVAEYRQAIKLAPKNSAYKVALGAALMRAGQLQEAAELFASILDREPNNASAHRLLALVFDATGQSANACGHFQEYMRLKPQAPDAGDIRTRMVRHGCE